MVTLNVLRGATVIFVPTIENGEELCIRVCFSFSSQNQVPQVVIGNFHFSVMIQMALKSFQKVISVSSKTC